MPLSFDIEDAFVGAAFALFGSIAGFFFGVAMDIQIIAASAFAPSSSAIQTAAAQAGVFPLLFAFGLAGAGFIGGMLISARQP